MYKIKSLISFLLLICWGITLTNNIMYWHGHHLANGRTIWHAHPYKKSSSDNPFPEHKHADWQLVVLDASTFFLICASAFLGFTFLEKSYFKKYFLAFKTVFTFTIHFANLSYRGPPVGFSA